MQYTKKVMEYFMHPKNMGKMENADAIGKVGNPTCLLPHEKIHKNSEVIEIFDIEKNHRVFTHNGNYETILGISSRRYNGRIIQLKNKLGIINITPEHLVYAMKVPKKQRFFRNKGKKELIPSWYHAENLKKGDIILYPILKEEKDTDYLKINISKPKYDFKSKEIPGKIPLDLDLLRLFGYFLAEGNIQDKPCKTFISFALNINEREIVEDIRKISKKLFNLDIKVKEKPEKKTICVFLYSARMARWFKELFGNGAEHKKIPNFIMNLPAKKQKSLIYGFWKGDGYVNLNREGPRAGFVTISLQLAQQIKLLLLRQKIVPSIYKEKERIINGVNHRKAYRIHVGQRDSLIKLCNILDIKYLPKSYASIDSWFDDNFLYTPITNKNIINYKGIVNNLEVENAHSFVSEAFCLHNCGDWMWLYLKVGKRKGKKTGNEQEYIKDIKFQTLGCAAAIATSSMITELAKGRTLEEAKKRTKNNQSANKK
ncbi:iron-sulfur cluster assembly scaffold protein [Candidatus Pacearchaeota archaeon]|nr:iron-sulfur cluster assembly scaffold protein [Candidatus Pacearchaeota archaeon]